MKFSQIACAAMMSCLMLGCSSGVKLNDIAVEDRNGTAVTALPPPVVIAPDTSGSAVGTRDVKAVELGNAGAAGVGPNAPRIIYFDYDSFAIKPEFQAAIEAHAKYLGADRKRKLAVEGHTDDRGGREYNLALGQKRSEAVRRALALLGVTDAQVEAVSFGKEKPATTGADEASLAKNRRAEISYR
jgi:peptidoglycan-associated lipoprotein